MDDTISRQAAIEAIEEMQIPIMRSEFSDEQLIFTGMSEALAAIKELPSAQPEVRTQMSVPDCISRQAAIDGLDGHRVERRCLNDWQFGWNEALEWVQVSYLEDFPSAQPEQRWIPVTERLPDKPDVYLISSEGISVTVAFFAAGKWTTPTYLPIIGIDAWMPLPEPYGERREG